mgnify:CR=1 FL=1
MLDDDVDSEEDEKEEKMADVVPKSGSAFQIFGMVDSEGNSVSIN